MSANDDRGDDPLNVRQTVRFEPSTYDELERRVERGEYKSMSEAVREAVRQLVDERGRRA